MASCELPQWGHGARRERGTVCLILLQIQEWPKTKFVLYVRGGLRKVLERQGDYRGVGRESA